MILVLAIRGLVQGTIRQVFALLGVVLGFWSLCAVSQWVGSHWQGARPAAVFWALRWLVALMAGLAAASLFQWFGELLSGAVQKSLVGWLDRLGGFLVGAGIGACIAAVALVAMLAIPWPRYAAGWAAQARSTPKVLRGADWAVARIGPFVPGSDGLKGVLQNAERRLQHAARHS